MTGKGLLSIASLLAAGSLALVVCGATTSAEEDPRARSEATEVLAAIAASPGGLNYSKSIRSADFATAREQAGLPADSDLFASADAVRGPTGALAGLTRDALPFVLSPFGEVAETEAFDGSAITASAATTPFFGEPGTVVIATTQDPEQIEQRLLAAGMTRHDGILKGKQNGDPSYFPFIAQRDDDFVVLTDERSAARAALSSSLASPRPSPTNAAAIAAKVEGSESFIGVIVRRSGCVRRVVAVQDVEPSSGQIELAGSIPKRRVTFVPRFSKKYKTALQRKGRRVIAAFRPRHSFRDPVTAFSDLLDKGSAITFSC